MSAVGGGMVLAAKGVSSRSCLALSRCSLASKGFMYCQRGMLAAARLAAREEATGLCACVFVFALNLCARSNVERRMRGPCRHERVAIVVVLDLALVGSKSASSANSCERYGTSCFRLVAMCAARVRSSPVLLANWGCLSGFTQSVNASIPLVFAEARAAFSRQSQTWQNTYRAQVLAEK